MDKYYHPVQFMSEKCEGRMKCMRACPTKAIRIRDGKAKLIEELCVDCGACIGACPCGAIMPLTDPFTRSYDFKYKVALPSPVLYSQFRPEVDPRRVIQGLKRIGFNYVCDVSTACAEVNIAIDEYLSEYKGRGPLISLFCPTIVRLLQVSYPDLTELVLPIDVPREIAAKECKERLAAELGVGLDEIGVIYITPCPAKMVSIRQPAEKAKSWIDGAISIVDIFGFLRIAVNEMREEDLDDETRRNFSFGAGWEMLGELTRLLRSEQSIAVSGLSDTIKIFDDIENSKLKHVKFVEASACLGGCIGGSLTVENMYVARSITISLLKKYGGAAGVDRARVLERYRRGYYSLEKGLTPRPLRPLDPDLGRAIEKRQLKEKMYGALPKTDCGCCGAPTCEDLADDVVRGEAKLSDCIHRGVLLMGKGDRRTRRGKIWRKTTGVSRPKRKKKAAGGKKAV